MTDSSSDSYSQRNDMASMAGELMQAKMDAARKDSQMTHVLRVGSFHMEIVPSRHIDGEKIFKETLEDLHAKFGDKILEIDIKGLQATMSGGGMHG